MSHITLKVRSGVLTQVNKGNLYQRQIAVKNPTAPLDEKIATANKQNKIRVRISGVLALLVGDTGAICGMDM